MTAMGIKRVLCLLDVLAHRIFHAPHHNFIIQLTMQLTLCAQPYQTQNQRENSGVYAGSTARVDEDNCS